MAKNYQESLDHIYSSYMRVKDRIRGKHDHAVRQPERIMAIAQKLDLIPAAERIIRITGSKGKGTTSRLVAKYLQAQSGKKIGLVVSPEEFDHTDRMSIDGNPIPQDAFIGIYDQLRVHLDAPRQAGDGVEYFSPSGIFLLIALMWFKQQAVDYCVLETGRGVIKDECGLIPSKISVVTSILFEHPAELGPTIADIAAEKLSIGHNSGGLIMGQHIASPHAAIFKQQNKIIPPVLSQIIPHMPQWLADNDALARTAVANFLHIDVGHLPVIAMQNISASFGYCDIAKTPCAYEAMISLDSLDQSLWAHWQKIYPKICVILSLPDDKDRDRLLDFFLQSQTRITEIVIEGHLHYEKTRQSPYPIVICAPDDCATLQQSLAQIISAQNPDFIFAAGTQSFIRLFKKSFALRHAAQNIP